MYRQYRVYYIMLILSVDDDSDDREFFGDAIKAIDPQIPLVVFPNGEELLYYLEKSENQPDYIFIDINMPKMNGYECAEEIRANYPMGETQIVMYSTSFNPEDRAKFEEHGFKYITKQHSLGTLVQSIKGVLANS